MTIGERIRKLRLDNKLSQDRFADLCGGVTKGLISQWENNLSIPPTERLLKLRGNLDFSFDWLLLGQVDYMSALKHPVKNYLTASEPPPTDEVDLLIGYRAASPESRNIMLYTARQAIEQRDFIERSEIK